jgi:hypothetical protein
MAIIFYEHDKSGARDRYRADGRYDRISGVIARFHGARGRRLGLLAALALLLSAFGSAGWRDAEAAGAYVYEWRVTGGPGVTQINNAEAYWLFSNNNDQYIKYGSRDYGINLMWSPYFPQRNVRFMRQPSSGNTGPLKYDEPLAMYVDGGGFLKYGSRSHGIDLVWSNTPSYEWRIKPQFHNAGEVINPYHYWMGLFNTAKNASLHYGTREYGINLKWGTDMWGTENLLEWRDVYTVTKWPSTTTCGVDVEWKLEPVTLTGDTGSTVGGTLTPRHWSSDGQGNCQFIGYIKDLKIGVWQVDLIVNRVLRSSCTVTIGRYVNYVSVLNGVSGCAIETVH